MTAYTQYFNRFLNSFNILSGHSTRSDHSTAIPVGHKISRQAKVQSESAEMRAFDNDLQLELPTEKNDFLADETSTSFSNSPVAKPLYSPFWFWNSNLADELALEFIREGDVEKARSIWEKAAFSKDKKKLVQAVMIDDLISQSSDWLPEQDEFHSLTKNGDEYIIAREKQTGSSIPCVFADLNDEENWTIEVDTQWFEGIDKYSYGIVFGREQNNYYSFVITGNGHFSLVKQTKGDYNEIIPWKKAFAINQCGFNHLLLKKTNDQVELYINNNYVGSVKSEPFFGKGFGFKVWGNQKVAFSKFRFCNFVEQEVNFEVTQENYSCIKNLSMLNLGLATKNGGFHAEEFKKGIELAKLFYTSNQKEGYRKSIGGEQYFYNPEKTIQFYLTEVVDSVKKYVDKPQGISTGDLLNLFADFPAETRQLFKSIFFASRIQKIDREIGTAKVTKKNTAAEAADAGKKLVKTTREDILYLRNNLGESNPEYAGVADRLARAIMQCGIDYYSRMFDVDYKIANTNIELYLPEHKYALNIAVSGKIKDRLKEVLTLYQKIIKEAKARNVSKKDKKAIA
ncbi:MAG: hypothetical protein JST50_01805 [Bacteroidetes bacterium]|jgi:hypothetical protein|nr:hypothetical protein [Bacteroidota bacterium]